MPEYHLRIGEYTVLLHKDSTSILHIIETGKWVHIKRVSNVKTFSITDIEKLMVLI